MHSHAYRLFITHCLTDFIFTFKTGRRNYTTAFNTALLLHVSFSLQSYLIVQRRIGKKTSLRTCIFVTLVLCSSLLLKQLPSMYESGKEVISRFEDLKHRHGC